jgi:hypothetical protein
LVTSSENKTTLNIIKKSSGKVFIILIIHSQHNHIVFFYSGYRFRSISDHNSGPSYVKFFKTWNAKILHMFELAWDTIHNHILR